MVAGAFSRGEQHGIMGRMRQAAVAYIEREDGRLLCVWNQRYGGWTLPGGMVEEGEDLLTAMKRELREETDTIAYDFVETPVCSFENANEHEPERSSMVHIFLVRMALGEPKETEMGSPVTWLTREQYLRWTPFARDYAKVFRQLPPQHV